MPWHAYLAMGLAVLLLASLLVTGNSTSVAKPKFKLTSLTELSNNTSTTPINVDLTGATLESSEVSYGGPRSAWWSYTPTSSYSVTFATASWNSNMAICVTTVIGSCTTASLGTGNGTAALVSGTTYYIRVSPNWALRGTFIMTRGMVTDTYVAPYDNFSNAQAIAEPAAGSPSAVVNVDLSNLTTEAGEVAVTGTAKTGWFRYTPTASYTINLIQQGLGGNIATCVTTVISSCSVGANTGYGTLAYALTSGTTYYIRVNPNTAALGYIVIARAGTDNDNFANATAITELSPGTNTGSISVNNINATYEVGEGNVEKGRWWKYSPSANQTINVNTGSGWSGGTMNQCVTTIATSCSLGYNGSGITAFALTAGTTYYIRLGNAEMGSFSIARAGNDNDQFANATAVAELADGASTPVIAVNYATATTDPTEYNAGYHSRWWSYAPTVNQTLNVAQGGVGQNGNNSFYQCVTTSVSTCSVGSSSVNAAGSASYALTAGTTYYIRLTTYGATDGTARFFRSSADNDLFANATTIGELSAGANTGSVNFDLSNAGTENGEVSLGLRSRWWKYTPTSTYSVTIAQTTSGTGGSSGTYQCLTTSISACTLANNLGYGANSFSYTLTSGTTYYLRISTAGSDIGSFRITRSGSDNDTFANATVISEISAGTTTPVMSTDLSTASKESGEYGQGYRSRWWSYTPSANQTINVNETTPSSAQSGAIYQCVTTTFGSCTLGDNSGYSKINFAYSLTSGTTYYIRIATQGADTIAFAVSRAANDNDLFANATAISELANNTIGSPISYDLTNASIETGEASGALRSRWWSYTPTASYSLRIDQGFFDNTSSQAQYVCVTTSIGSCSVGSTINFNAAGASYSLTSGTTYYIRISTTGPLLGSFVLSRGTVVDSYVTPNDNFASATTLSELAANAKGAAQSVDLTNATVEGGEVSYATAKSAWWKYTPTTSYTLDIAVAGITGNMAGCVTTSITTCTQGTQGTNTLGAYALTAGTTYYIRLSPNTGVVGTFMIWRTNTGNDNFANATAISELSAGTSSSLVNVDTSTATYEPTETTTGGDRRSLWWSYTPTSSYTVDLVNYGAGGDLSYCMTTAITSCSLGSGTVSGMYGFSFTSGTTYYLRVSGAYQSPYGAFRLVRAGTANNDMFANATAISEVAAGSASSTIGYDLTGATIESGEVSNGENRSLWWSYTPTSSYTINVAIAGEGGPTASCITTSMTSCTTATLTANGTYAAALTSGTTYYIRVSSAGGSTGTFSVRRAGTNNDNFANATAIGELAVGASSGLIAVDTRYATIEPGEVSTGEQRSLWWSYTPTSSYTVDVMAYSLGAELSVCITTSIASCTLANTSSSTTGVAMTSGTTYYIRMSGNGSNLSGLQLARAGAGNDNFANATAISELTAGASTGGMAFDTSTATVENGEVSSLQQRSLWWKYTPTASYTINAAVNGDGGNAGVCITTAIGSCATASTSGNGIAAASLTSGNTYYIRIASNGWATGTLMIIRANTGNDNFANASTVQQSDITAPSTGNVYDGTVTNTETPNNNGSTTSLSANWSGFADAGTGIANYDYSIGTSAGDTSVKAWTSNGTTTSVTATGLSLAVGSKYFFNVRATDFASNTSSVVSSTGQTVAPILTFTSAAVASATSCGDVTTTAASGTTSSYVDPGSSSAQVIFGQQLSVTTNAANGYTVNVSATPLAYSSRTIAAVPGTNAAPQTWPAAGTEGFGYATSSSTLSGTANRFRTAKFAGFSTSGAEVMRNTAAANGDSACIAMGLSQSASTPAGLYASAVTFTAIPTF